MCIFVSGSGVACVLSACFGIWGVGLRVFKMCVFVLRKWLHLFRIVYLLYQRSALACAYMCRVGQNCIFTPYMTVYLVTSQPKITYMHRIYMVRANPKNVHFLYVGSGFVCV